jgi:hypothetical protein
VEPWPERPKIKERRICSGETSEQSEGGLISALVGIEGLASEMLLAACSENAHIKDGFVFGERPLGEKVAKRRDTARVITAMEMIAAEAYQDLTLGLVFIVGQEKAVS